MQDIFLYNTNNGFDLLPDKEKKDFCNENIDILNDLMVCYNIVFNYARDDNKARGGWYGNVFNSYEAGSKFWVIRKNNTTENATHQIKSELNKRFNISYKADHLSKIPTIDTSESTSTGIIGLNIYVGNQLIQI